MKNILLAKLDIDTKSLSLSLKRTTREIQILTQEQEKLLQKGKESSQQYQVNDSALKGLIKTQKSQSAVLASQILEESKLTVVKKENIDLAETQSSALITNAKTELDAYVQSNSAKVKNSTTVSKELFETEQSRLENILAEESRFYNEKLLLEDERHAAEVAKNDLWQADGIISAQQYNQYIQALDEETAQNKAKLAIESARTQISSMQSVTNALGEAFGQTKELAIAQATMNAGQAILSIWAGTISGNPIVDAALKSALTVSTATKTSRQIKEIHSAKKPKSPRFERGGLMSIGGNRHSAGGTAFLGADGTSFEAEQGELIGVMNRKAAIHFMAFNNAFPSGGVSAPNYLSDGGIVSRVANSPSLNIDELAIKIANANRLLPTPVISIEDIISESNNYVRIRDAANF